MAERGTRLWRLVNGRGRAAECTVRSNDDGSCELRMTVGVARGVEHFANAEEALARAIDLEMRMMSQHWVPERAA
jgi:hypothetical protein